MPSKLERHAEQLSALGHPVRLKIWSVARYRSAAVPFAVGAYITAAYWFTSSTSCANPAVTLARGFSDTFAGIRPTDVPGFIAAQLVGAGAATALFRWLAPAEPTASPSETSRVVGDDR